MSNVRFTWDEAKNQSNQRKHGISFEVAARVFSDPLHLSIQDRLASGEERWRTLGLIDGMSMIIVVAHTYTSTGLPHELGEEVRIITARLATPKERRAYEKS